MPLLSKITQNQFNIRINIAEKDLFDIYSYKVIKEIQSTKSIFAKDPTVINADPFLFVHNNTLHLFYEEQINLLGKGVIKMISTKDLKSWTQPKTILEEKFHLSFPYVFRDESSIFMMPESGNDESINLYIPNSDFTQWIHYKTLLRGKNYVDSSIMRINETYYLFTSIFENNDYTFLIYSSESINGKWRLNSSTPIKESTFKSRCGGSIFEHQNELYRPVQITENKYGEGLVLKKIVKLTKDQYLEKLELKIIPNADKFYKLGGHHFNYCYFLGFQIVATDALSCHLNILEVFRRLRNKVKK